MKTTKNKIIVLTELENQLAESDITFNEFDTGLWFYLCALKERERIKIAKQLKIIGKYYSDTNIGNIRLEIFSYLKINFMLN